MEKKINRTKGKIVRGIRVDVAPNCAEEEKTRIIEQIVRAYFEMCPNSEVKCIVLISTNGKKGMHRIRVETDIKHKTETHREILRELQNAGMQNAGLLQDDSIFYAKSGLKYEWGLRIGYLFEHPVVQLDMENAIATFSDTFAPWCTIVTSRYTNLSWLLDKVAYVGSNVGEFHLEFAICLMGEIKKHQAELTDRDLICWKSITVRSMLTDEDVEFGLIMKRWRTYLCEEYK